MFWDGDQPGPDYFGGWGVDYIYVGCEICPVSKREHYQGYVRFPNPRALGGVRKLFTHEIKLPDGNMGYPGHWEACKGSEAANIAYCSKEDNLVLEAGLPEASKDPERAEKKQGKRTDILLVRNMIKKGAGMLEIVDTINTGQAIKIAETMLKYLEPGRNWIPEVFWIYGPTGAGKSKYAFDSCANPWVSGKDGKWFEGYDAHEDVIFDDFRNDFCPFHVLLRLLDRYPYRVEVKGASRQFLARRIFITSCHAPHKVYSSTASDEDVQQLGRRIAQIIYMPSLGKAYQLSGSEIGQEPSAELLIPEHGPERKVWGNTTEPPTQLTPSGDVDQGAPALTRPQTILRTGPKESKCFEPHGPDFVCDDCEFDDPPENGDPSFDSDFEAQCEALLAQHDTDVCYRCKMLLPISYLTNGKCTKGCR